MKRLIAVLACFVLFMSFSCMAVADSHVNETIRVEEHVFQSDGLEMAYLLYLPQDYDPSESYRLVLFMHGAGDIGFDFERLHNIDYGFVTAFKENAAYYENTILLIPQCPSPYIWVDDWATGSYAMQSEPTVPIAMTKQLSEYVIQMYSVDRSCIYAVGVSMGGMAVWDMLARYPDFFAAAAPICGSLDETKISEYARTPIFTANDIRDTIVGAEPTARVAEQLKSMGADIVYKQYDTAVRGDIESYHSSWVDAFSLDTSENNLYSFVFSKKRVLENEQNVTTDIETIPQVTTPTSSSATTDHKSDGNAVNLLVFAILVIGGLSILLCILFSKYRKKSRNI